MQVFKAALRIFFKHPVYILIYIVWLSCMAVFIGTSIGNSATSEFAEDRPTVAFVDRDGSELSRGLEAFVGRHAEMVAVEDTQRALQDAVAQNQANYIMIVAAGFGADFEDAARSGAAAPAVDTVTSYVSVSANMMDGLVDEYLGTARLYLGTGTAASLGDAVRLTAADMAHTAAVNVVQVGPSAPVSQQFTLYMQFSGYTIMLSITVCISVMMGSFNQTDVRRRDLTSPISSSSMSLQLAAACIVIALMSWAWVSLLGLAVFGHALAGVDPAVVGLVLASLLVFCTLPLALGFLLGQVTTSPLVVNAVANIAALVMSFLGGIWVSLEFMGQDVVAIAHFMPTFYYGDAVSRAINLHDFSSASLMPILADWGIVLLFSLALFAVALVAGRLRVQSSDAGGNAAAALARS